MAERQKIAVDGIVLQEGQVFCDWLHKRFNQNKNALITIMGATGSGKSYASIRLAELWYKRFFNETFPTTHICFTIHELAKLLNGGTLRFGDIIIFEEAGVSMSSLDFQNRLSKIMGFVLQSFRSKNICVIFNLPSISFLNKTARVLMHLIIETDGINKSAGYVKLKPLLNNYNVRMDKSYNVYMRVSYTNRKKAIKRWKIKKPSEEILIPYEKMKDAFVNSVISNLVMESKNAEQKDKQQDPLDKHQYAREVVACWKRGIISPTDIANYLQSLGVYGRVQPSHVSRLEHKLSLLGYKKAEIISQIPKQAHTNLSSIGQEVKNQ